MRLFTALLGCVLATSALAAEIPMPLSMNAALTHSWAPYSDSAYRDLGSLTITEDAIIFSKGLKFSYQNKGTYLLLSAPQGKKKRLAKSFCATPLPLSASIAIDPQAEIGNKLTISFYDTKDGPGPDRNFDLHRCTQFVFVTHPSLRD